APELPRLIEGNWNCRRSLGVFQWMGKHENPWENDNAVLALVSHTRRRLLALEAWCSSSAVLEDPQVADLFETAWRALLLAESSDPLGWRPHQGEVTFAVGYCDRALRVLAEIEALLEEQRPAPENYGLALPAAKLLNEPPIVLRVLGAEYDAVWAHVQPNLWHVEVWLRFNGDKVRVGFPLSVQAVGYSPSGLEQELVTIPFDQLRPRAVHVPAANGLVQVGEESFVIKDTSTVHLAARIDRDTELVEFVVDGAAPGKETAWRFWLFRGTAAAAVDMANKLNMC
ncbi:MAG TPA: hypothetical protein VEQ63_04275, partial [Bryobacteraceae bacterium]|nr:hypothetical protein [Bryobacteraceae bacterium]